MTNTFCFDPNNFTKKISDTRRAQIHSIQTSVGEFERLQRFGEQNHIIITLDATNFRCSDGEIKVYLRDELAASLSSFYEASLTDLFIWKIDMSAVERRQFLQEVSFMASLCLYMAAEIMEGRIHPRHSQRGFYTLLSVKDGYNMEIKLYDQSDNDFIVHESGGNFSILCNQTEKKAFRIPDPLYPMPNKNKPILLYSGNAVDIDDGGELAEILSNTVYDMGYCYTNAEKMLDLLTHSGYTQHHSVQYVSGWVFGSFVTQGVHHAWLVVDHQSVIDSATTKAGIMNDLKEQASRGMRVNTNREVLARKLKFEAEHPAPFKDKYFYGKPDGWLYIGTESTPQEARDSFNSLLRKYPMHPAYNNINKDDGSNALSRAYYTGDNG